MRSKPVFAVLAACVSGFLGGMLSSQVQAQGAPANVIRAPRFELVNRAGATVAVWEVTPSHEIRLRFATKAGGALEIGAIEDGRPFFRMLGRDGKNRLAMGLDQLDKPSLGMSDEKWYGRVRLGFTGPDTLDPSADDWALSFCPFGTTRPIAGVGMVKNVDGQLDGYLTADGKVVR